MQYKLLSKKYLKNYLSSTVAPAASNFSLKPLASSFETPVFNSFGAPSTRSFASFKPNPVIVLTSLITLIFLSPAAANTIVNSSFSSAAAASPEGAAPAAATATVQQQYAPFLF